MIDYETVLRWLHTSGTPGLGENKKLPEDMGGFYRASIFAAAKIAHLSDDKTVAKMGHPMWWQARCGPPVRL